MNWNQAKKRMIEKEKSIPEGKDNFENITIPVIEEFIQVEKRKITTGKLRIQKKIMVEEVDFEIPVRYEEFEVERVAVNKYVEDVIPATRQEGETIIIPVLGEVVEKRVVLVEEIRLTKKEVLEKETHKRKLRKEKVTVEHVKDAVSGNPEIKSGKF
jgi:uncharacterized protein (TIGR02271 family)